MNMLQDVLGPLVSPEAMRARANSANNQLHPNFWELRRCDKSENDLESFTGGMPTLENSWIDKRDLDHRYNTNFRQRLLKMMMHGRDFARAFDPRSIVSACDNREVTG
jgi:hypothetical protein